MPKLIYPDYINGLVNVINSILRHYGIEIFHPTLKLLDKELEKNYKNVVIILFAGFGSNLLTRHLGNT